LYDKIVIMSNRMGVLPPGCIWLGVFPIKKFYHRHKCKVSSCCVNSSGGLGHEKEGGYLRGGSRRRGPMKRERTSATHFCGFINTLKRGERMMVITLCDVHAQELRAVIYPRKKLTQSTAA
jgi:hypothetical protein